MRVPHIINGNTHIEYLPTEATLNLRGEADRAVFPENFTWDDELCPSLVTLCVRSIAGTFKDKPLLDELPCADRCLLLEILPTDLPLEIVVPLIEDEIYWQRRYSDKFGVVKYGKHASWTWKCLYLERHLQDIIENAQPEYYDEENMEDITTLLNPYVHKLLIMQLRSWKPPLTWEKDEVPDVYPTDHINFEPILARLDYIEELDVTYAMKEVSTDFTWNMFKLSIADCRRLSKATLYLKTLKIFRLHRCAIDDDRARTLTQNLIKHKMIVELDLSHCLIDDQGALCIAKVMLEQGAVQRLILTNNRIGVTGALGLGFALLQDNCCPIVHLNLRLNPLRHDGVMGILRALVRGERPEELVLAACLFEEDTSMRIGQMLRLNASLKVLDVGSNWFSEAGSQEVLNAMSTNRTLEWMDLRETDVPADVLENINKALLRNRLKLEEGDEESTEEEICNEEEEKEIEFVEENPIGNVVADSSDED